MAEQAPPPGGTGDDEVLLTAGQKRRAEREARRQAKDAAYEERQRRRKLKDGTTWRGHHVVDTRGLADAFPDPETPEIHPAVVRRRITHGVTLVVLIALVVAGLVLVGMVQRGELDLKINLFKAAPTPDSCPSETLNYTPGQDVSVNVFNGGGIEGLAGKVAGELKRRGFQVKNVANGSTKYLTPSVMVSGKAGMAAAYTLQQNFPDSEYVLDGRDDASVDVIVTDNYTVMIDPKVVNKKPGQLSCPRYSPTPSDGSSVAPSVPVVPPAKP